MSINSDKLSTWLAEVLEELDNARKHVAYLEGLAESLREGISSEGKTTSNPYRAIDSTDTSKIEPTAYRRKQSHATRIYEIAKHSDKRLTIPDIIKIYVDRGINFPNPKNAYNILYRAIKDRSDILRINDGYIEVENVKRQPLI